MLRREYLRIVAGATASGLVAATSKLIAAAPARVTGVQLYAVRAALKKDPDRVLQALAGIGFKEVEGYSRAETVALAPKIKAVRAHCCDPARSKHRFSPRIGSLTPNSSRSRCRKPSTAWRTRAPGTSRWVTFLPGARGDDDDFFRRTADRMNAAAELCRKSGLRFAWQNHAFEFEGQPGQRPIDIYKERLDPKLVGLELNVFWASIAGQDPLRLLKEWKGHVPLLQLNDKAKDAPRQFSETIGIGAFVEAGSGDIDFPAILKAAPAAGVKFQFAGQDETEAIRSRACAEALPG